MPVDYATLLYSKLLPKIHKVSFLIFPFGSRVGGIGLHFFQESFYYSGFVVHSTIQCGMWKFSGSKRSAKVERSWMDPHC